MKQHRFSKAVLWFAKITGLPFFLYFKYKIYCKDKGSYLKKVPKPSIIMCNHTSLLDFVVLIEMFYFRTVRFLMAEVLFDGRPVLSRFLSGMGGIRVNRRAYDMSFVGEALDSLDRGQSVGIFPEGRLPLKGEDPISRPFKPGIIYIALRTDVPIIPIYTDGRYGLFKRARVMIGEEIRLSDYCKSESPSKEEIRDLCDILKERVYALRDELERIEK